MTEWFKDFVARMCAPQADEELDLSTIPYDAQDLARLRALSAYDKPRAHSMMADAGSTRPIPYLISAALNDKDTDARCSAINALRRLGDERLVPVFVECLAHRSSDDKWYAMMAINQHAGPEVWETVLNRVMRILARDRKTDQLPRSELIEALDYLHRNREQSSKIDQLFESLRSKYAHRLSANETKWLSENTGGQTAPTTV